jgi:glycosyltransferase involved in cell wall biosynthesis
VHFLHTAPEDLGRAQGKPEKGKLNAATERRLMAGADLVVGVGPLLAEHARRLAGQSASVHELIPGMDAQPMAQDSAGSGRPVQILLFGRAGDPIKGVTNAAHIVRELAARGLDPQLTVRGASPDAAADEERRLSKLVGRRVWVKPFTTDPQELTQDLWGANLVIVPSLIDGLGLVAAEAAAHRVPFLVGSHTGIGMFLTDTRRVPALLGNPCVVPDASTNTSLWADHAQKILTNLPAARARAADLRTHLGTNYTWKKAGTQLMEALAATTGPTRQRGQTAAVRKGIFPPDAHARPSTTPRRPPPRPGPSPQGPKL